MKSSFKKTVFASVSFSGVLSLLFSAIICLQSELRARPSSLAEASSRVSPVQKYRGFEVKTGIVNDEIQYSQVKENSVEFTIGGRCELDNIRLKISGKEYGYRKVERVIEDGRIEKNDLFAYICYDPEALNGNRVNPDEVQFRFYRGKVSPLINPDYPLYATLKLSAERQGIKVPHRTFVVLNGFGGASHEFFCYPEGAEEAAAEAMAATDSCLIPFEEVLEIHFRNKNPVALKDLGDKYARRFDYERAEKAYLKALSLPGETDHQRLVELYLSNGQGVRARRYLQDLINRSPLDFTLRLLLARVYLYEKEYDKAIEEAGISLKLEAGRGRYESYAISGRARLGQQDLTGAIEALDQAAVLAEKECQESGELRDRFFRQEQQAYDCRLARLPYCPTSSQ